MKNNRFVALLVIVSFVSGSFPLAAFADSSSSYSGSSASDASDACNGTITPGSQKVTYCNAATTAQKAADDSKTLMMVWGGVSAICLVECVGNLGTSMHYICPGAGLAAGATELILGNQLQNATKMSPPSKTTSWIDRIQDPGLRKLLATVRPSKESLSSPVSEMSRADLRKSTPTRLLAKRSLESLGVLVADGSDLIVKLPENSVQLPSSSDSGVITAPPLAAQSAVRPVAAPANQTTQSSVTQQNVDQGGWDTSTGPGGGAASAGTNTGQGNVDQTTTWDSGGGGGQQVQQVQQTKDIAGSQKAGGASENSGPDSMACIAAAAAAIETYMKYSDYKTQSQNAKDNFGYAATLNTNAPIAVIAATSASGASGVASSSTASSSLTAGSSNTSAIGNTTASTSDPTTATPVVASSSAPSSSLTAGSSTTSPSSSTTANTPVVTTGTPATVSSNQVAATAANSSAAVQAFAAKAGQPGCSGSADKVLACASKLDSNLPAFVTHPEFLSRFQEVSGQTFGSYLHFADGSTTPTQALQTALSGSVAPQIASQVVHVLNDYDQHQGFRSSMVARARGTSSNQSAASARPAAPVNRFVKKSDSIPADAVMGTDEDLLRGVAPTKSLPYDRSPASSF